MLQAISSAAADLPEAQAQLLSGDYAGCVAAARKQLKEHTSDEDWQVLLSKALLATGRYPEALSAITNALERNSWSVRLRWQAREVFLSNGMTNQAEEMTDRIAATFGSQPRAYGDAIGLVIAGQAALLKGADPKRVLDLIFAAAQRANPKLREVYLAAGNLALEKHDYALAARKFEEGLKQLPNDPDLEFGLAQAYAPSDSALAASALETTLTYNTNHLNALLLLVDRCIDGEDFVQAAKLLDSIQRVNPWHPEAWAYRAVLAHFQNEPPAEERARQTALKFWPTNPRVDWLIGRKLSQNYRFAEGAAHQRQALSFDPDYLPAQAQLAQDLLRLGNEAEGWKLAEAVRKQDGYDVAIYNLTTLRESLAKFAVVTNQDFLVRMSPREAVLYGASVLELLEQAKTNLCAKYGMELKAPTVVEIFPEQKDFAVRTFGMPGNPGYLGVCFGSVITANSPAAQAGHPVNWQAVLWHEFCHVVTLQKTRNKMPRWLSEGISVYEERQANGAWGERMNPHYREMILGSELVPVSKLSAAFLAPRSALHLQFAYYEASLVVEYIVQRFGFEPLKGILDDLGQGREINQALEQRTVKMAELEQGFARFAQERAKQLAPGLDWTQSDENESKPAKPSGRPNFYALRQEATALLEQKDFQAAKAPLLKLVDLYPEQTGSESAYALLAVVYRALGETNQERQMLSTLAEKDDEAKAAYLRLMELGAAAGDWPIVLRNAHRFLAVDPLVALPYRYLALAAEHTNNLPAAITAYRALLQLEPPDPAETHFRLAQALYRTGDTAARREVLEALEEAPRHRAALRLLLDINKPSPQTTTEAPSAGR